MFCVPNGNTDYSCMEIIHVEIRYSCMEIIHVEIKKKFMHEH